MGKLDIITVFIASPGDLAEERNLFPLILSQLNEIKAEGLSVQLKPLGWEDTLPGWGRPQALINDDVRKCDIFVMLLWKRWGTPSGEFDSGTEEEFRIAYEAFKKTGSPYLLLYFRSVPQAMMADPGEQLKKVLKFRAMIEEERIGLFRTYDQTPQWKDLLMKHLSQWLDRKVYGNKYATETDDPTTETPLEIDKRLIELQVELQKTAARLETTQSKLRTEAVKLALEAMRLSEEGSLTLAEEKFARSLELYEEPAVLQKFALVLRQTGSLDRARELFERVLRVTKEDSRQTALQANAYAGLGVLFTTQGALNNAESMFLEALKIDHSIGRNTGMAISYVNLGNVYSVKGDLDKAEEMYQKALAINESIDRKKGLATSYINLGNIGMRRGDLANAKTMYARAMDINTMIGRKKGMASSYVGLGSVYATEGFISEAEKSYKRAINLYEKIGVKEGLATAYANLGSLDMARNNLKGARKRYQKALDIYTTLGHKRAMAGVYMKLGTLANREEDSTTAAMLWAKATELSIEPENDEFETRIQSVIDQRPEPIIVILPPLPEDSTLDDTDGG